MRLNAGQPVWHVSVSAWSGALVQQDAPAVVEREAIRCLAGAGGDREWWWWNPVARVGHLRVPLTPAEVAELAPGGPAVHDAGETGHERPRTRA